MRGSHGTGIFPSEGPSGVTCSPSRDLTPGQMKKALGLLLKVSFSREEKRAQWCGPGKQHPESWGTGGGYKEDSWKKGRKQNTVTIYFILRYFSTKKKLTPSFFLSSPPQHMVCGFLVL